jgi:glutamate dehydrogenase
VARAWGIARDSFEARALWQSVEALDTKIPAAAQYAIHGESARLLRHATVWLLRRRPGRLSVAEAVAEYHGPIAHLRRALPRILEGRALEAWQTARARHAAGGVPAAIAAEAASLAALDAALDICELARTHGAGQAAAGIEATAQTWFGASAALSIDLLEARIDSLTVDGALQAQARAGLRDGLRASQVRILGQLIGTPVTAGGRAGAWSARWQAWSAGRSSRLEAWRRTLREVEASGSADFASLSVCVDALRALAD